MMIIEETWNEKKEKIKKSQNPVEIILCQIIKHIIFFNQLELADLFIATALNYPVYEVRLQVRVSLGLTRHVFTSKSNLLLAILF